MKKLYLLFAALILLVAIFFWVYLQFLPAQPDNAGTIDFIIPKSQTASQTVDNLAAQKLIKSAFVAKIYLQLTGLDAKIQAGNYSLSPKTDLKTLLNSLTHGAKDIWITIPEGWRREQIAARLQTNLPDLDTTAFLSQTSQLEGQLFPDTYLVPIYASASDVISIMTTNFSRKAKLQLPRQQAILIVASLVERETKHPADRPLVAGILFKRLKAGWPLQVDATIQYAKGNWEPITDTTYPSLYNTYLHLGLPPTPICNPGLASITAALNPQDSPYWFYLTDSQGITHYSQTLEEHNLNIDKHLRP